VVYLKVEDEVIVRRLSGRRICPKCGNPHHVEFAPPQVDNQCDRCGTQLVHRADDQEGPIRHRLQVFHAQTGPLVQRYGAVLETVDGNHSPEVVLRDVVATLRGWAAIAGSGASPAGA